MTDNAFRLKWLALFGAVISAASPAQTLNYDGNLGDPTNTSLIGSDSAGPSFSDANAVSNNVALYDFVVPVTETVSIVSTSFATGGVDPYLTLFQGSGGTATFFDSNYNQAFSTGGDLDYSATLTKGSYEMALGVFANLSFAENYGSGTLADGFTGLGDPGSLGNGAYAVKLTLGSGMPASAPEIDPSSAGSGLILLIGMLLVARGRSPGSRAWRVSHLREQILNERLPHPGSRDIWRALASLS